MIVGKRKSKMKYVTADNEIKSPSFLKPLHRLIVGKRWRREEAWQDSAPSSMMRLHRERANGKCKQHTFRKTQILSHTHSLSTKVLIIALKHSVNR
jgi:hypothetical protein